MIARLDGFPNEVAKETLPYLADAPLLLEADCPVLRAYLERGRDDETADLVLHNRAFETLFSLWDGLVGNDG